jgi:hypothetical protein
MADEKSTDYQIKLVNNPMNFWATIYAKRELQEKTDAEDPTKDPCDRFIFSARERSAIHAKWRTLEEKKKAIKRHITRRLKLLKRRTTMKVQKH